VKLVAQEFKKKFEECQALVGEPAKTEEKKE